MLQTVSPPRIARLHARVAPLEFFLPHSMQEHRLFQLLSVTAGICEEFLYRGFIMWALAYYVGLPAAIVLQAVIFSLGHIYQGNDARSVAQALLKTGAAGLILGAIAVASGSLIPGMIVHALVDLSSGDVAFALLSQSRRSSVAATEVHLP
jgi:membrane protease YdiL (CAAX protease family)